MVLAETVHEYNSSFVSRPGRCVCAEHPESCGSAAKVSAEIGRVAAVELRGEAAAACERKGRAIDNMLGIGEKSKGNGDEAECDREKNLVRLHGERNVDDAIG